MKKTLFILLQFLLFLPLFSQSEKDALILEIDTYYSTSVFFQDQLDRITATFSDNLPHINTTYWESVKNYFYTSSTDKLEKKLLQIGNEELSLEELQKIVKALQSGEEVKEEILDLLTPVSRRIGAYIKVVITQKLFKDLRYKDLIPTLDNPAVCKNLKTGNFLNISPDKRDTVFISRINDQQTEKFRQGTSVFNLEWLDDHVYKLFLTNSDDDYINDLRTDDKGLIAEIYEVTDQYYRCYYSDYAYGEQFYGVVTINFIEKPQKTD